MNATIADAERIAEKIDGYVRGCKTGEESPLKDAFHVDARMYGALGSDRYDMPVLGGLTTAVAERPTGDHDARILSIDVEGDAACVKLAESGFWDQDFINYFLLSRIDGDWQIVAKCFAHTGASA